MADTKTPRRSAKPMDAEARAFAVVTDSLADLSPEAVHRVLDHVAKRHGFYVVTDLPALSGEFPQSRGEQFGEPLERHFEPPVTADPHAG